MTEGNGESANEKCKVEIVDQACQFDGRGSQLMFIFLGDVDQDDVDESLFGWGCWMVNLPFSSVLHAELHELT